MAELQGPTVLVTGASSGIGRATAVYLAQRGYSVLASSRSLARLADLQAQASAEDLRLTPVELDINSDENVERVLSGLLERHGVIDVLVNNAGYGLWGPLEGVSMSQLKAQFEVNFFGAARLIKAVLPGMVRRRRGTIVNVSSVLGRMGTPFYGAYVASKFALEGLSESLRIELWPLGVRVALVEPGLFRTNFHSNRGVGEQAYSEEAYAPYIERYMARHARFQRWAADPMKVAKVVHKIVRSRRPAFRYPVGPEARLGSLGARLMPERLFQALLSRASMK